MISFIEEKYMQKTVMQSVLIISEIMLPSQANPAGNIHGGEIMKLMDSTAYAVARRYARSNVVTARVDELEFHLPIFVGDLVVCIGKVIFAGKSSMEVAVTVEVEDLENGVVQKALTAFFTMVAIDKKGRPHQIPELILDSDEDRDTFEQGAKRYEAYKQRKRNQKQ